MRVIFADTSYWIATTNPRDQLHRAATELTLQLGEHRIITSDIVLVEVLNTACRSGSRLRNASAALVQMLLTDPSVEVVPFSFPLFHAALSLYGTRPDKSWSLTDCASFLIMDERRIGEALTFDHHFEQNGYRALLRDG